MVIGPVLKVQWCQLLMQKLVSVLTAGIVSCCHPFWWLARREQTHIVDSPCLPRSIAMLDFINSCIHILCLRPWNCAIMTTCINNGSCPQINCQVDVTSWWFNLHKMMVCEVKFCSAVEGRPWFVCWVWEKRVWWRRSIRRKWLTIYITWSTCINVSKSYIKLM